MKSFELGRLSCRLDYSRDFRVQKTYKPISSPRSCHSFKAQFSQRQLSLDFFLTSLSLIMKVTDVTQSYQTQTLF